MSNLPPSNIPGFGAGRAPSSPPANTPVSQAQPDTEFTELAVPANAPGPVGPPPAYPAGPGGPQGPSQPQGGSPKTSGLAIASLVVSFFVGLVGLIMGAVALKKIKTSGEGGKGLAIGAIVVGALNTLAGILFIGSMIAGMAALGGQMQWEGTVTTNEDGEWEIVEDEGLAPAEDLAGEEAILAAGYTEELCDSVRHLTSLPTLQSIADDGRVSEDMKPSFDEFAAALNDVGSYDYPNSQVYVDTAKLVAEFASGGEIADGDHFGGTSALVSALETDIDSCNVIIANQ